MFKCNVLSILDLIIKGNHSIYKIIPIVGLQEKYSDMFEADIDNSTVIFSENLVSEMLNNNENGILISEVKMNAQE